MFLVVVIVFLVFALVGAMVVSENPGALTIYVGIFEISSSVGMAIASSFGLGLLTGVISMFLQDLPNLNKLRDLDGD